ncbi:hypothetical protein PSTT_17035, partial [Puccinia striiformis]
DSRSSASSQDPSKDNSASRKPSQSQKALTTVNPESRLDTSKKRTTSSRKVHDLDFKLKVIQWHQEHKATQLETSLKFNINQTSLSCPRNHADSCDIQRWFGPFQLVYGSTVLPNDYKQLQTTRSFEPKHTNLPTSSIQFHINKIELHGEAGSVNQDHAEEARKQLLAITSGYVGRDIYNTDEDWFTLQRSHQRLGRSSSN